MKKIKTGIIGGAGYTGGETLRLLLNHPHAEISLVHSRSHAGKAVHTVHEDLLGETDLIFTDKLKNEIDVLFLCLGHGESKKFLESNSIGEGIMIIDLSQDFRLGESFNGTSFVYGLPELNREQIKSARYVANPGCFATAIQLGLLPLAAESLLTEVHLTGITGSSGAGQRLQETTHFTWRVNNISAYKTLSHQHQFEIMRSLKQLQTDYNKQLYFLPWRGDFSRGIFVSAVMNCEKSLDEVFEIYQQYYAAHPFCTVTKDSISLKQVVNTNKCLIQLEKVGEQLIIHTAIDNLIKGASGQAVQNMNLMFGLDEQAGLKLKSIVF
ncbi:MAG TPA: N-acetyl-gamma-glutamyl-phosphate reductase [Cyclobacteriaceae bacterium]|nr:N-acetyl-gamma-glutamyl-phosphate reductase [Cyclobacteriaceae bacterium]